MSVLQRQKCIRENCRNDRLKRQERKLCRVVHVHFQTIERLTNHEKSIHNSYCPPSLKYYTLPQWNYCARRRATPSIIEIRNVVAVKYKVILCGKKSFSQGSPLDKSALVVPSLNFMPTCSKVTKDQIS